MIIDDMGTVDKLIHVYLLQTDGNSLTIVGLCLGDAPAKVNISEEYAAVHTQAIDLTGTQYKRALRKQESAIKSYICHLYQHISLGMMTTVMCQA